MTLSINKKCIKCKIIFTIHIEPEDLGVEWDKVYAKDFIAKIDKFKPICPKCIIDEVRRNENF